MARISKTDHPRILHLVDVERRKVVEVAAEYGCTAANIYALLGKMRRAGAEEGATGSKASDSTSALPPPGAQLDEHAEATAAGLEVAGSIDLFAEAAAEATPHPTRFTKPLADVRPPVVATKTQVTSNPAPPLTAPSSGAGDQLPMALPAASIARPTSPIALVKDLPKKGANIDRAGTGSALAKAGFGLAMRTADGDENVTPFRSLDDLLSAIKPILRSAARSPDAIWFSIQQVDLATLDVDTV